MQKVRILKIFPYSQYAVVDWNNQYVACKWMRIIEKEGDREPTLADLEEEQLVYWGQGHYFDNDLGKAIRYAIDREEAAWERHKMWLMDSI